MIEQMLREIMENAYKYRLAKDFGKLDVKNHDKLSCILKVSMEYQDMDKNTQTALITIDYLAETAVCEMVNGAKIYYDNEKGLKKIDFTQAPAIPGKNF